MKDFGRIRMRWCKAGWALVAALGLAACAPSRPLVAPDINAMVAATQSAARLGDKKTVVKELTVVAERWPDRVAGFNVDFIERAVDDARRMPSRDKLALLRALYAAHWRLRGGIEPSAAWRDLTLLLLEEDQRTQALEVASHITDPYILIAMRADRRFDSVVAANEAEFDVDAAAEREFHDLEAASDGSPRSLVLQVEVLGALMHQQHYAAMLAAADSVLAAIRSTNFPERLYVDLADQQPWFLEYRSIALYRAGRWDEAVEQMQEAAALFENHAGNISQRIDLGELDCELGRPKEALAAIGDIEAPASPFGAMQIEKVRLEAAVQLGDAAQVKRSLGYLRAHRRDSFETYEQALIAADDLDRAARVLTDRLADADERQAALASVQDYAPEPEGPVAATLDARLRTVIAREDVQNAIKRVGRAERYDLVADYD
jgi:tetratricopeptide (TPR) repeat protein